MCHTLIENESKLRVHLQGDESRPQSMDDSREESNRSSLQNLMDLKAQVAILKRELGPVTPSETNSMKKLVD